MEINKDILFDDVKEFHVTDDTIKDIKQNPHKYTNCDVRIRMGLVRTNEEQERYITESLKRPMPGAKIKSKRFGRKI